MIRFIAIFFLVTMILNVTLPLMEQLQSDSLYELVELEADDKEDETKNEEKESEKEKEYAKSSLSVATQFLNHRYSFEQFRLKKCIFSNGDLPLSALYTVLPELPPEL